MWRKMIIIRRNQYSITILVRSASRIGYSDLGVNRKRMEAIRARFDTPVPPPLTQRDGMHILHSNWVADDPLAAISDNRGVFENRSQT
jgi:hypothetical protein